MNYSVYTTPDFQKFFKKLYKKYPSLKTDLAQLISVLSVKPDTGINLGHGIFKIRLAISSKSKGKSGGARVITYLVTEEREIYLVYIYDKSEIDSIRKEQIFILMQRAKLI